ncbi:MAG: hypothetical protein DRR08_28840 [Candidatus Parabeggiatoa sp. nov. 2]|nr:MAG: hypothetical protein B6247_30885 [Beggiatoa sp. 4572_84]RKZ51872.1 MAG: hypothetical protein DRR08_28840 [Gammaproteobacteria bacterium]
MKNGNAAKFANNIRSPRFILDVYFVRNPRRPYFVRNPRRPESKIYLGRLFIYFTVGFFETIFLKTYRNDYGLILRYCEK